MSTTTTNLELVLPEYDDLADIQVLAENFQKIDDAYRVPRLGAIYPEEDMSIGGQISYSIGDIAFLSFRVITSAAIQGSGWKTIASVQIPPQSQVYCAVTLYNGTNRTYTAAEGRLTTAGAVQVYQTTTSGAGSYIYFQFIYRPAN